MENMVGRKGTRLFLGMLTLGLALVVLSPFYLVLVNAMKTSAEITINPISLPTGFDTFMYNLRSMLDHEIFRFWSSLKGSVIITILSLVLITITASMTAWVLCRNKTRWSTFIFLMLVSAMVIPFQVVMLPLITVFRVIGDTTGLPMLQSYFGLIFAYIGFGSSISVFILHGFIKGIPLELEEAAAIDGCTRPGTFFKIILPLLKPIQVTILILNGIWIWNDFLLPSILLGLNGEIRTLPIAVQALVGAFVTQWNLLITATFLAMLPIIILFIFAQKYIIKGVVEGAIK